MKARLQEKQAELRQISLRNSPTGHGKTDQNMTSIILVFTEKTGKYSIQY